MIPTTNNLQRYQQSPTIFEEATTNNLEDDQGDQDDNYRGAKMIMRMADDNYNGKFIFFSQRQYKKGKLFQ